MSHRFNVKLLNLTDGLNFGEYYIKLSLYLPYYFNLNEEHIVEETRDTEFKKKYSNPLTKRKYLGTYGKKHPTKSIYSLDKDKIFSPDVIGLRDDLFKIQSSGYWKNLTLKDIGMDKKGNPVHGKTWVTQTKSWFEATKSTLIVSKKIEEFKGKDAGYIYVVRNPNMEQNIFKIGLTQKTVEERINQLSNTSVPDKFYKLQEWNVKNCIKAEKEIHQKLGTYRVDSRREFFRLNYDTAAQVIREVVERINSTEIE